MSRLIRQDLHVRGARAAGSPATRGQRSIWADIEAVLHDTSFYSSTVPIDVPVGTSREEVLGALSRQVVRHDSLRTLFHRDALGTLVQTVCAEGAVAVEILQLDSVQDSDYRTVVTQLIADVQNRRFDHTVEWPVRAVLAELDGALRIVVLVVSQLAADYQGQQVLAREMQAMLSGMALPPPAIQPVELAAREEGPEGRRMLERSIEHWRRQLRRMPVTLSPGDPREPETPRYPTVWLRSRAMALAAGALSTRYGSSTSTVCLAATALLLGRRADMPRTTLLLIAGNRTGRMLRDYVGTLVEDTPATVELTGATFGDVVRSTWTAALSAYRNAHCDRETAARLRAEVGAERNVELDLSYHFNDTRLRSVSSSSEAEQGDVRAALADTRLGTGPGVEQDNLTVFLRVHSTPDAFELRMRTDSRRVSLADGKDFLRDLEAFLVVAAEAEEDVLSGLVHAARGLVRTLA